MKWLLYQRGTIHPHRADIVLRGVFQYSEKLAGNFVSTLYINLGSKLLWSWKQVDIDSLVKIVLDRINNPNKFKSHFEKVVEINDKAIATAEKIRNTNLKDLSNRDLVREYHKLDKILLPARGLLDTEVDAVDIGFEDFLIKQLKKLTNLKTEELLELYKKISRPIYQSYVAVQEKEIIKLALKNTASDKEVNEIYQKFWWTNLGWENIEPHSVSYFKKSILNHKKLGQEKLKNKLKIIDSSLKEVRNQRQELVRQYKLDKNISYYLNVIDKYNMLHDARKECQVKSIYAYHLLTCEIAKRSQLKIDDLEWLLHSEVIDSLQGKKLDKKEISSRKKAVAILVSEKGIKLWSGQEALDICKQE